MAKTEVRQATIDLEKNVAAFMADLEEELRHQRTKTNYSSERRTRALLRTFRARVYLPYKEATRRTD